MSWYTRILTQTATYWGPPQKSAWGDSTYPSPATLSCHWEEKAQLFIDKSGAQSESHAAVLTSTEVKINGKLFFGTSAAVNPDSEPTSDTIRDVERVTTIRGDVVAYRALL